MVEPIITEMYVCVETKHPTIATRSDPESIALRGKKLYLIKFTAEKKTDLVDACKEKLV